MHCCLHPLLDLNGWSTQCTLCQGITFVLLLCQHEAPQLRLYIQFMSCFNLTVSTLSITTVLISSTVLYFQNKILCRIHIYATYYSFLLQIPEEVRHSFKKMCVELLSAVPGHTLLVSQFPSEFSRLFKRPFYLSDFKVKKLVHLLLSIPEVVQVSYYTFSFKLF